MYTKQEIIIKYTCEDKHKIAAVLGISRQAIRKYIVFYQSLCNTGEKEE